MTLTVKQKAFADYYIETVNASASYRRAGYQCANDQVAEAGGSRLLSNVKVREYVDKRMNVIASDRIMTAQEILSRLSSIARGEVEAEVKDQIKAMDLVLKRYPQYSEQIKDEKTLAETELIRERTKLLKGVQKDTTLLESLVKVVSGND